MNKSVLIVDDEPDLANLLARFCIKKNLLPKTANSLSEARTLISDFTPDFAILDFNLGDGLGVELIPLIKNANSKCYIGVFTAYTRAVLKQEEHLSDINEIFEKPTDLRLLKSVILKQLNSE